MEDPSQKFPRSDHDLLVALHPQIERVLSDIKEVKTDVKDLKDNTTARITNLEEKKVSKEDFDAYVKEAKESFAPKWVANVLIGIGSLVGVAVVGALLSLIFIKQ